MSSHCMSPFGDPAENVEPDPTLALISKDSCIIIVIPLSAQCFNKGRKKPVVLYSVTQVVWHKVLLS